MKKKQDITKQLKIMGKNYIAKSMGDKGGDFHVGSLMIKSAKEIKKLRESILKIARVM